MSEDNERITIFPFTTRYFEDVKKFEYYIREVLPDILTIEHTQLRKPHIIIFAYQGDHCLWGYAEIESWKSPSTEAEADVGREWGGSRFRRLYKIKPCSIREFKKHIPYSFLSNCGFNTSNIKYAPELSVAIFNQIIKEAEGETNCCI